MIRSASFRPSAPARGIPNVRSQAGFHSVTAPMWSMAMTESVGAERTITLRVDGTEHRLTVDLRRTLLDLIRDQLGETAANRFRADLKNAG